MFVLRKTFGPYSAGTRVELLGDYFFIADSSVLAGDPVPTELVAERRSMTTMVPKQPLNHRELKRTARKEKKKA